MQDVDHPRYILLILSEESLIHVEEIIFFIKGIGQPTDKYLPASHIKHLLDKPCIQVSGLAFNIDQSRAPVRLSYQEIILILRIIII